MKSAAHQFYLPAFLLAMCVCLLMQPIKSEQATSTASANRATIRVGMWTLWHDREIRLKASGDELLTLTACAGCPALKFSGPVAVKASGEALQLVGAGQSTTARRIEVHSAVTLTAHNENVTLHNPVAISARNGALIIAVTLPIETYVERVVASESGNDDSAESLKALAVVVRSFALHEPHGHTDYNLCDSTHCQLLHWGRSDSRWRAAHEATLATTGETLWFHGQRALAYFSKDCGGRTASPAEIWPRAHPLPYLPSQQDRYCTASSGREWASQISRADLAAALATRNMARPGWRHITISRRGDSGRAVSLRLDDAEMNAEDFRLAIGQSLGWSKIPSTWFEVNEQGDQFYFHGRGWGHGVGLCQKGAAAMAGQNQDAVQILAQYFPGAQAADEITGRNWQSFTRSGFVLQTLDSADAAYLPDLERARAEAAQRSGLNMSQPVTIRTFPSTAAFRNGTNAPGWVAAFTEGDWIGTQPLRTLASRHLLDSTMRHEYLHVLIEEYAGPTAPLWLREGLVELWAEPDAKIPAAPSIDIAKLDSMLAHSQTEAESTAAHRAAKYYASRLIARYGREEALSCLRSGLPSEVVFTLRQR